MRAIIRVHMNRLTLDVEAVELYVEKELWYDEYCDSEWDLECVYNSVEEAIQAAKLAGVCKPEDIQLELVKQKSDQEVFQSYDELYDHEA